MHFMPLDMIRVHFFQPKCMNRHIQNIFFKLMGSKLSQFQPRLNKNTCVYRNPTLPKFTGETYDFLGFLEKNTIVCIVKGELPFTMNIIIFFPEKKNN